MKIKRQDIQWELKPYLKIGQTSQYEFHVWLNRPLADWDVFDVWEKERTRSMVKHLNRGDILFDVGAEMGWLSCIYGQIVGASNMVLIEPTDEFWANIEALWHKNFDAEPLACYHGLFSNKTSSVDVLPYNTFPPASADDLIDKLSYTYIHENPRRTPEISLDDYVAQTGIVPTAITIDVEGAEYLVLQGAEQTIQKHHPMIWVSEHDDLAERGYQTTPEMIEKLMWEYGYQREVLATDHERHVRYF